DLRAVRHHQAAWVGPRPGHLRQHRQRSPRPDLRHERTRTARCCLYDRIPRGGRGLDASEGMKTIRLVTADEDLRARLLRPLVLRQAEDRHRLLHEVAALRSQSLPRPTNVGPMSTPDMPAAVLEQALKEFARALAAGFDLPRMLELFLDAVGEMVRPSRSALL